MPATGGPARALVAALAALATTVVLAAAGGCGPGERVADLDGLPYRLEPVPLRGIKQHFLRGRDGPVRLWMDVDGDDLVEHIHPTGFSILCETPRGGNVTAMWQKPLPPPFHLHRPVATFGADYDLDGDGRSELVAVGRDSLRTRFRIWVLDPRTGDDLAVMDWSPPPERDFPDGRHDVGLTALGGVERPDGDGQWLVVVVAAGFDHEARAVMALDPARGTVVWSHALGPSPHAASGRLHDVDGDGRREILLTGRGVGNRAPARVNGASDDSSHVHVIGADGRLRWQRALERKPSGATLALADLDGDGVVELVTVARHDPGDSGSVTAWRAATGERVAALELAEAPDQVAVLPGAAGDAVVVSGGQGTLWKLALQDGRLVIREEVRFPPKRVMLRQVVDLVGDAAPELILDLTSRGAAIIDDRLRPLAMLEYPGRFPAAEVQAWEVVPGEHRLLVSRHPEHQFRLVPSPARWPLATAALAVVVLGGAAGLVWRRRRADDPAVIRQRRRRLLDRVSVLRHETFGTLENLERLQWQSQAAMAGRRPRTGPDDAIGRLVRDTRQTTLDRLAETVGLARRIGVREHRTASLAESVTELTALLDRYERAGDGELAALSARLREIQVALQLGCRRVREDAEQQERTPLLPVLAGVLRAQSRALADAAITVTVAGEAVAPETWTPADGPEVIMDPDDLGFLLDNLVGNAIRAMHGIRTRRLAVAWDVVGDRCLITVDDTGCGIPPEDRERVLAGEGSRRPDGGFGLVRSQESLKLFRGRLSIARSEPGRGTTFLLDLRRPGPAA